MTDGKATGYQLWTRFWTLRTAIFAYLESGIDEHDTRIMQARQQQRKVAEELVLRGFAKGIAIEREGDLHHEQQIMAKVFDQMPATIAAEEYDRTHPKPQVITLKTLRFQMKSGKIGTIAAPPNRIGRSESLRAESRAATYHDRSESAMEGRIGVDYVIDEDPASDIVFYVPITDR